MIYASPGAAHSPENVAGYNFVFNADSGFGALAPITADNFDLAYENYWGKSSSFTLGLFYKRLNGSIAFGEFERDFVNNGTTQRVLLRGPRNGEGGGTLKGVEVAFQTFFDFLPGAWRGLGAQLQLHSRAAIRHRQLAPCSTGWLHAGRHDRLRQRLGGQRCGDRFTPSRRALRSTRTTS